jgi:hypothetical protein
VTSFLLVLLAVLALPILAIATVVRRSREVQALADHGRVARGRVADRRTVARGGSRRGRRVLLTYEQPDTGQRQRWISVTTDQWSQMSEGAAVDVVYLPEKPDVFATRSLVNDARRAKGLGEI